MTPSAHDSDRETPEIVARRFAEFAHSYSHLTLYAAISRAAATDDLAVELTGAARPGQARPVLLLAALHDLVLRRPDLPVARWYPSVTGAAVPPGDPWPDVRAALADHADELRAVIAGRATQTNEVNRVVHVARMVAEAAADVPDVPVALVEMGASAGLLLGLDRYRIEIEDPTGDVTVVGDPASSARAHGLGFLSPTDDPGASSAPGPTASSAPVATASSAPVARSVPPAPGPGGTDGVAGSEVGEGSAGPGWPSGFGSSGLPRIVERVGLDREPVDLSDPDAVRWLEACLWPDQPERLERFRAAVEVLRADPPTVVAGDMVDDLEATLHSARAVATALAADLSAPTSPAAPAAAGEPESSDPSPSGASSDHGSSGGGSGGGSAPVDVHLIVFSSWALTYVARERRAEVAEVMARLAADGRPVSWLTAEPPGAVPGIPVPPGADARLGDARNQTALGARRWRAGVELPPALWGTCHPHGERFDWGP